MRLPIKGDVMSSSDDDDGRVWDIEVWIVALWKSNLTLNDFFSHQHHQPTLMPIFLRLLLLWDRRPFHLKKKKKEAMNIYSTPGRNLAFSSSSSILPSLHLRFNEGFVYVLNESSSPRSNRNLRVGGYICCRAQQLVAFHFEKANSKLWKGIGLKGKNKNSSTPAETRRENCAYVRVRDECE